MKNLLLFRTLATNDIKNVLKIYNFHIKNGLTNFEEKLYSYDDFVNFL